MTGQTLSLFKGRLEKDFDPGIFGQKSSLATFNSADFLAIPAKW